MSIELGHFFRRKPEEIATIPPPIIDGPKRLVVNETTGRLEYQTAHGHGWEIQHEEHAYKSPEKHTRRIAELSTNAPKRLQVNEETGTLAYHTAHGHGWDVVADREFQRPSPLEIVRAVPQPPVIGTDGIIEIQAIPVTDTVVPDNDVIHIPPPQRQRRKNTKFDPYRLEPIITPYTLIEDDSQNFQLQNEAPVTEKKPSKIRETINKIRNKAQDIDTHASELFGHAVGIAAVALAGITGYGIAHQEQYIPNTPSNAAVVRNIEDMDLGEQINTFTFNRNTPLGEFLPTIVSEQVAETQITYQPTETITIDEQSGEVISSQTDALLVSAANFDNTIHKPLPPIKPAVQRPNPRPIIAQGMPIPDKQKIVSAYHNPAFEGTIASSTPRVQKEITSLINPAEIISPDTKVVIGGVDFTGAKKATIQYPGQDPITVDISYLNDWNSQDLMPQYKGITIAKLKNGAFGFFMHSGYFEGERLAAQPFLEQVQGDFKKGIRSEQEIETEMQRMAKGAYSFDIVLDNGQTLTLQMSGGEYQRSDEIGTGGEKGNNIVKNWWDLSGAEKADPDTVVGFTCAWRGTEAITRIRDTYKGNAAIQSELNNVLQAQGTPDVYRAIADIYYLLEKQQKGSGTRFAAEFMSAIVNEDTGAVTVVKPSVLKEATGVDSFYTAGALFWEAKPANSVANSAPVNPGS